ncbi:hypothetical protein F0562_006632 [Nyssa sinensis]|uniref:Uncharacterized protein n=1 Tax=Nyssa sinensis TaxID=561372 RepID=A0A5J5ARJ4_9ASTE|nr:hypothetical protein F0562_006632 [Nyssa sinensis]
MTEQSSMNKKLVDEYLVDMSKEERLRREREKNVRADMKKKIKMINTSLNDQPSDMPIEFKKLIKEMGGDIVKLVMQKALYLGDITPGLNHLSMPLTQIKEKFLNDEDMKIMESHNGNNLASIDVPIIGPSLDEYAAELEEVGHEE